MKNLNNITLVSISGLGEDTSQLLNIFDLCKQNFKFNKTLLLTADQKEIIYNDVEVIKIPKLNWSEYNKFHIYNLSDYIKTDYCLTVQSDGFIINPHLWDDDFLNYDYIGAPWICQDLPPHNLVGNGGFSLRSKKILEEIKNISYEYNPGEKYDLKNNGIPEDVWICSTNYFNLINKGIKFPSIEVARKFSNECFSDLKNSFGFHGKFHVAKAFSIVQERIHSRTTYVSGNIL